MLTTVTLTGADDSVKPEDLAKLSIEFPFVEWGILIGSRDGSRFPSPKWIQELIDVQCAAQKRIQLSLHVCESKAENDARTALFRAISIAWDR